MKEVVAYVTTSHGLSERRACALTRQHRSTQRKPSTRDPRLEIRQRMHGIARVRIRYGYRRLHVMLRRDTRICECSSSDNMLKLLQVNRPKSWRSTKKVRSSDLRMRRRPDARLAVAEASPAARLPQRPLRRPVPARAIPAR